MVAVHISLCTVLVVELLTQRERCMTLTVEVLFCSKRKLAALSQLNNISCAKVALM